MEPKRELASLDLVAVVRELAAYTGATCDKAYLYPEELLRLKLRHHDRGRVELLVDLGETKRCHVASVEHVPEAPERPPNFAKMLRNRISGADLADVRQYAFDRVVELEFDRPDVTTTVVCELFGQGNVAVLDANREVVDCLDTVRLKSRTVAPGSQYEYPGEGIDPREMDRAAFGHRLGESDADVVRTLATRFNFGGTYAEEVCTRAGVDYGTMAPEADEATVDALFDAATGLLAAVDEDPLDPRVYAETDPATADDTDEPGERVVDVTPVPLEEHAGLAQTAHETFMGACDAYFVALSAQDEASTPDEPERPDFEEQIERTERIIDQQEQAIVDFEAEAATLRERAELCYANYGLVDEVLQTVREARTAETSWAEIEARLAEGADRGIEAAAAVVGVDPANGTVTVELDDEPVELDPTEGVEHNVDRLYREAKAVEEKADGARDAIEDTRAELADLEAQRDAWEPSEDKGAGDGTADADHGGDDGGDDGGDEGDGEAESTDEDWLAMASVPVRPSEQWYERFRWFRTSDGFLVIGGRNADQNEELVKKYTERGDRVLHAQAHGGPVTVLKATGPSEPAREVAFPEASLEQAAQFAVSYASPWKDGHFTGDVYAVDADQVTKTPESGEYLEKGAFAVRGERTYYRDVAVGAAVGIQCAPYTRVIGGPPAAIEPAAATSLRVEPGRFARDDVAKKLYRAFRERFADTAFVRRVASPDEIAAFLPPGGSRILEE